MTTTEVKIKLIIRIILQHLKSIFLLSKAAFWTKAQSLVLFVNGTEMILVVPLTFLAMKKIWTYQVGPTKEIAQTLPSFHRSSGHTRHS